MNRFNEKFFFQCAAVSGMLAVMIGAFGAHSLKQYIGADLMTAYRTGVQYQFYHTFAIMAVGFLLQRMPHSLLLRWSGLLFGLGILFFSGGLYAIALSGLRVLGIVAPLGGLLFIVAWFLFWLALFKREERNEN